jgi:deazaflavin-dependent oxidoreductase (nitroreductase family)
MFGGSTVRAVPLPKRLARINLAVTNPVLRHAAKRLPGFAIVHHVGRRSGTPRSNPVNLFEHGDAYVIALTYGRDSQWVKNVLAAGRFEVETRGRRIALTGPEIVRDETLVPKPVRAILHTIRVRDYLIARPESASK